MRCRFIYYFSLIFISINAQRLDQYIVLINKDSIICSSIEHRANSNGRLNYLKYTTLEGKTVEYTDRFKVPKLDCFRYRRQTYEMIPRKNYNQKKRKIVGKRLTDGVITYCYFNNEKLTNVTSITPGQSGMQKSGFKLRYVRLQDGKYIKLTKGTMKRKIKPILKSCEQFVREYKGDYKLRLRDFIFGDKAKSMFELYNRSCPNGSKQETIKSYKP